MKANTLQLSRQIIADNKEYAQKANSGADFLSEDINQSDECLFTYLTEQEISECEQSLELKEKHIKELETLFDKNFNYKVTEHFTL